MEKLDGFCHCGGVKSTVALMQVGFCVVDNGDVVFSVDFGEWDIP